MTARPRLSRTLKIEITDLNSKYEIALYNALRSALYNALRSALYNALRGLPFIMLYGLPFIMLYGLPFIMLYGLPFIMLYGLPFIMLYGLPFIMLYGLPFIMLYTVKGCSKLQFRRSSVSQNIISETQAKISRQLYSTVGETYRVYSILYECLLVALE